MGIIQLNQIAANIELNLGSLIDVSDVKVGNPEDLKLSRGLAAWALVQRCQISNEMAASAITDGFDDNGIDAVWVDHESNTIYLVQSKWSTKGTGSISAGDMHKYLQGVRDFVNAEFTKFNTKFQARRASFEAALEELDVHIILLLVHSGADPITDVPRSAAESLLKDMNDPIETVTLEYLSQKELHAMLRSAAHGRKPDIDATLYDWGAIEEPYRAFYGQVAAHEVAGWYEDHGTRLLADNIRQFLGDSEVNQSITETLMQAPDRFWYLNNGITALCDSFTKAAAGGTSKKAGKFRFAGVSIVNGAQTVGCLAAVNAENPDQVADARVTVRFISLEGCPPEFAQEVTRGTNTQNRVERRDFVSLDPIQDRLAADLNLSGIRYAIKSGSETPSPDQGFTVTDATVALACANGDPDLSTQAKREVGRLWIGAESPASESQYRMLFAEGLSAERLWRAVRLLRQIDSAIASARREREGRGNLVGVHGNRLIAHAVFAHLGASWGSTSDSEFEAVLADVEPLTAEIYDILAELVDEMFEGNYLASLFKNGSKCRELAARIHDKLRGTIS
jgi:hypothetical protein